MAGPAPAPNSGTGLAPNVAGALAYLLGPITGIVFLLIEKNSAFVRFHAVQSIVFGVIWIIFWIVLSVISSVVPVLGWIVGFLISIVAGLGGLVLWLLLMYKAYQGQEWELPVAGPIARKQMGNITV
ncbi:MAG TPA: DUF4870 domain-containing protein [Gemmatimonadales bacterium]|nr:DUF4870 domain-containing protein [Gemmatimonadales bacterium]